MSENQPTPPVDLGIYNRANAPGELDPSDKIAIAVTAIWLVGCVVFISTVGLGSGDELGSLRFVVVGLAIILPMALIWIATLALKSARVMREESERLQASMDAMRQLYINQAQMAGAATGHTFERKIDEIVQGQKRTEDALAEFATSRSPAPQVEQERVVSVATPQTSEPQEQPGLALGTPADVFGSPVTTSDSSSR